MRGDLTMTTVNGVTAAAGVSGVGVQELDAAELSQIEGGILPLVVGFAIGFALGYGGAWFADNGF
jgi:lactobin A/cerein 7B family class IIb bacteriocin